MHVPLHAVMPTGHRHKPPKHHVPALHVLPHAPQLALSVLVSTHPPLQLVVPPEHAAEEHAPPWQVWVLVHIVPHAPQLLGSVAVLVHAPAVPHALFPTGQLH
jgi:hypothetical protein